MCCTRISHVYRFHIHLKSDKWNFAIHSSMNCTAFISTTQQISALTSTKYTYSLNIMYDIFCACLLCFFMGIVCTIIISQLLTTICHSPTSVTFSEPNYTHE